MDKNVPQHVMHSFVATRKKTSAMAYVRLALWISMVGQFIFTNILWLPCNNVHPGIPNVPLSIPIQNFNISVSQHVNESAVLCTIAVNEEAYLDEWVDYYYGLGFSAIFLYDNSIDHDLRQWAHDKYPYGFVTIKRFPGEHTKIVQKH